MNDYVGKEIPSICYWGRSEEIRKTTLENHDLQSKKLVVNKGDETRVVTKVRHWRIEVLGGSLRNKLENCNTQQ